MGKLSIKRVLTTVCTWYCLRNIREHGKRIRVNFPCKFTKNTVIGDNCHFNGMEISGKGKVSIGDNFHSGKRVRVVTSFHNYDHGERIPYDDTLVTRDVLIGDNVWIGQDVTILGGVTIGEGAVIQAGSVVCKSIPPLGVAGGHPAKVFKTRDEAHYLKLKEAGLFY